VSAKCDIINTYTLKTSYIYLVLQIKSLGFNLHLIISVSWQTKYTLCFKIWLVCCCFNKKKCEKAQAGKE